MRNSHQPKEEADPNHAQTPSNHIAEEIKEEHEQRLHDPQQPRVNRPQTQSIFRIHRQGFTAHDRDHSP